MCQACSSCRSVQYHQLGQAVDGARLADVKQLGEQLPYRFRQAESQMPFIETVQGAKSPVEISAEILRALRERAEATLGGELVGAVITVPAYFDDAQRQATRMRPAGRPQCAAPAQ